MGLSRGRAGALLWFPRCAHLVVLAACAWLVCTRPLYLISSEFWLQLCRHPMDSTVLRVRLVSALAVRAGLGEYLIPSDACLICLFQHHSGPKRLTAGICNCPMADHTADPTPKIRCQNGCVCVVQGCHVNSKATWRILWCSGGPN